MGRGGGSLNLEILRGGGLKQFWKSRWEGGSKTVPSVMGVWIFSGITQYIKGNTAIGSKTWSSKSNKWLKSENKATRSKKATEIGSLALCLRRRKHRYAPKHDITLLAV